MKAVYITDHIKTANKETCIANIKSGQFGNVRQEPCTKVNGIWISDRKGLVVNFN